MCSISQKQLKTDVHLKIQTFLVVILCCWISRPSSSGSGIPTRLESLETSLCKPQSLQCANIHLFLGVHVEFMCQYSLLPCIHPDRLSHAALHIWFESLLRLVCSLSLMPVKSCTSHVSRCIQSDASV